MLIAFRQRKIMVFSAELYLLAVQLISPCQNPAFGPAQVRGLTEIFVEKSIQVNPFRPFVLFLSSDKVRIQLRDLWAEKAVEGGGVTRINVLPEFSTATMDIIGKAGTILLLLLQPNVISSLGFGYDFNALGANSKSPRDELHEAFATISAAGERIGLMDILKAQLPLLRSLLVRNSYL